MAEQGERNRGSMGDEVREGIRAGIGILSALKDAVEETVQEMLDRGELSPDRAREAVRTTMERAQAAVDDARTRLDFATRRELEELRAEIAVLRTRVDALEASPATPGSTGPASSAGPEPDIPISEG